MERCACGAEFEAITGSTHPDMLSVPGCWKMYGEILAREYQDSRYMKSHRLTVDTYAAQHPGVDTAQARNSVGIHLTRLCLILDFGWPIEHENVVQAWARSVWSRWISHHEIVHHWAQSVRKETR
jgi:Family of unknown function (DUF5946)